MVDLASAAGTSTSSAYIAGSSQGSGIRSGPLQVLEFEEAGMPAIKYVSS
jgi:hypothetical protein